MVSITARKAPPRPTRRRPWFRFFFGDGAAQQPQTGLGSGVIVTPDGYLLTNNHVIEGADDIEVQLADGRTATRGWSAPTPRPTWRCSRSSSNALPAVAFGNTDNLQVGDVVLAIGNPFGVGQTVTSGIVSALGRDQLGINTFENFIQTDAAINPGNSGGALVDTSGNLVGINTAIYSRSGGSLGIGFAIPVNTARQVMDGRADRDGQVTRGWIGVEPRDLTPRSPRPAPAGAPGRADHRRAAERPGQRGRPAPGDVVTGWPTSRWQHRPAAQRRGGAQAARDGGDLGAARARSALDLTVTVGQRPKSRARQPQ